MSNFKERVNAVKVECDRIQVLSGIISSLWEIETDLYAMHDDMLCLDFENFDFNLFPYHKALFPLRDFVYTFSNIFYFEREGLDLSKEKALPSLVFDPKRRNATEPELKLPGYCPCSSYSVIKSIVPLHRAIQSRKSIDWDNHEIILAENHPMSSNFSFLDEWSTEILVDEWDLAKSMSVERHPSINVNISSSITYGPEKIESEKRFSVLSRVLKHSISSIQRDHRLARAVLLLMTEYKCLDDEENLRLLFIILSSDSQQCNSNCHRHYIEKYGVPHEDTEEQNAEFPQHYCDDFQNYRLSIRHVLAYGMNYLSNVAVTTIVAFINSQMDPFSSSKVGGPIPDDEWSDVDCIPWIREIIGALHSHGYLAKHKMVAMLRQKYSSKSPAMHYDTDNDFHIAHISESYENCVRALVYIGEAFLLRLQPSDEVAILGGYIVKALITIINGEYFPFGAFTGIQYLGTFNTGSRNFPTVLSVSRYSDIITSASNIPKSRLKDTQDLLSCTDPFVLNEDPIVKNVFLSLISKEMVTVVRGLFLRQLVDVTASCCGYGDFLVWSRQPISCHDKLLYYHGCNFPVDDEEIGQGLWGHSAEGTDLNYVEIAARYDFSLLLLKQAWRKPWSVMSHPSFSPSFREAMWTLSLCASRKRIPVDLFTSIFQYIPRSWYSDFGQDCWLTRCQVSNLYDDLRGIATVHEIAGSCPNCLIACACSTQHALDLMYKEGHKRACGLGPLRKYGSVEDAFCRQITSLSTMSLDEGPLAEDKDSDDSSWESIDSEREERDNLLDDNTRQMISFFSKDYKVLSDDPEFHNFLRTRDGDY